MYKYTPQSDEITVGFDNIFIHINTFLYLLGAIEQLSFTSFCWPTPLSGCCWFCSNHCGAPPWTICSRNQTRLINAHRVHVTTKQPCKQSANKFSLLKRKETLIKNVYCLLRLNLLNTSNKSSPFKSTKNPHLCEKLNLLVCLGEETVPFIF